MLGPIFAKKTFVAVHTHARSLSFVGTRPIDLINSFAWQQPEDSDVDQKLQKAVILDFYLPPNFLLD